MILTNHFLGLLQYSHEKSPLGGRMLDKEKMAAVDSFEIVIQLGAILAVVGLYRKRVGQMCRGLTGKDRQGLRLVTLLFIAFLPAAVIGLATHKTIEKYLFGPVPVTYALAAGGILMILVEYFFWIRRRDIERVTQVDQVAYWQAAVIGCAQVLAMWPGTSRSMVTMLAALVVGLDMVAAAEFSFLLALPTLGAATLYSAHKDWGSLTQAVGPAGMILGLVVSAVVAAIAVKGFVHWLTRHGLYPFGIYRLLTAIVMFWLLAR
jgi:undecaprenyl-diphosphatase